MHIHAQTTVELDREEVRVLSGSDQHVAITTSITTSYHNFDHNFDPPRGGQVGRRFVRENNKFNGLGRKFERENVRFCGPGGQECPNVPQSFPNKMANAI